MCREGGGKEGAVWVLVRKSSLGHLKLPAGMGPWEEWTEAETKVPCGSWLACPEYPGKRGRQTGRASWLAGP